MPTTQPSQNALSRLPTWFSRWFGYRASPVPPQPNYIIWIWGFIGSFGGLAIVQIMFTRSSYFVDKGVPPLIASYGASAVLIYGVLDGPLAQPRALIGGHFLSAILGTAISKLFLLLPPERFVSLQFLASSLSTAIAIVLMQMTGTSHPPAGATALIPILDDRVRALGWEYVWVVLLTSTIMGVVAMGTNNVSRRWPVWWIGPPAPVPGTLAWPTSGREEDSKSETDSTEKGGVATTMGTGGSAVTPARDPTLLSSMEHERVHKEAKEQV
ncbi:HPP family protein [Coprinopsis sp. MPI-PUGE-AT-0042]|nr:HPP family protein [Coprinopsis sp. MPI-PUGE-AT-0042]